MRVFILTLGTRGDFELFCTLGRELRRRHHEVVLGTSAFYAQATQAAGLEWSAIGDGTHGELIAVLRSLSNTGDRLRRVHLYFAGWVRPQLQSAHEKIALIRDRSDYFISNLKLVIERDGQAMPGAFVSYDPPDAIENLTRFGSTTRGGRILELVAMNRQLVDPEAKWGPEFRFTGFWDTPVREAWTLPPRLMSFLREGPSPVVMTLGIVLSGGNSPRSVLHSWRKQIRSIQNTWKQAYGGGGRNRTGVHGFAGCCV